MKEGILSKRGGSEIQDNESNLSSDVLCMENVCERGSDGNNCEQNEGATTNSNSENNEESANGDCNVDVEDCQQCIKLQKDCDKYQQENTKLRLKVIGDDFLVDDVKTKYYTGLPLISCCRLCLALLPLDYLILFKMGHAVFFSNSL